MLCDCCALVKRIQTFRHYLSILALVIVLIKQFALIRMRATRPAERRFPSETPLHIKCSLMQALRHAGYPAKRTPHVGRLLGKLLE